MIRHTRKAFPTIFICFLVAGCTSSVFFNTYTYEGIKKENVRRIAILPVRNAFEVPNSNIIINRRIQRGITKINPTVEIIDSAKSNYLIGKAKLTNEYARFLRDYEVSGIIDADALSKVGKALNVDAILQGDVKDLSRKKGGFGVESVTKVTLKYFLISTRKGILLWQGVASARHSIGGFSSPPPIEGMIELCMGKILESFPRF